MQVPLASSAMPTVNTNPEPLIQEKDSNLLSKRILAGILGAMAAVANFFAMLEGGHVALIAVPVSLLVGVSIGVVVFLISSMNSKTRPSSSSIGTNQNQSTDIPVEADTRQTATQRMQDAIEKQFKKQTENLEKIAQLNDIRRNQERVLYAQDRINNAIKFFETNTKDLSQKIESSADAHKRLIEGLEKIIEEEQKKGGLENQEPSDSMKAVHQQIASTKEEYAKIEKIYSEQETLLVDTLKKSFLTIIANVPKENIPQILQPYHEKYGYIFSRARRPG